MMKKQKLAMTLVELTVVLVIVGILATLSMPLFTKTIESTKGKEAEVALDQIWAGERIYRTEQNFYYPKTGSEGNEATINTFLRTELDTTGSANWGFSINSESDPATFTATGSRIGGSNNGETLTIDETGTKGGTFSP